MGSVGVWGKWRYGLIILNFIASSNHIHLWAVDDGGRQIFPRAMPRCIATGGEPFVKGGGQAVFKRIGPKTP